MSTDAGGRGGGRGRGGGGGGGNRRGGRGGGGGSGRRKGGGGGNKKDKPDDAQQSANAPSGGANANKPKKRRQKNPSKRGGGSGRGGGGDKKSGRGGGNSRAPAGPTPAEIEAQKKAEAEAAEALRLQKLEEERKAQIAALEAALAEREAKMKESISTLKGFASAAAAHLESRERLHPDTSLPAIRKQFQASKKSLKSDLKKCTAFVKKVRSTLVWDDPTSPTCTNPTSTPVATMCKDITTLNLSRYVEEIAAALLEVIASPKTKLGDIPGIARLCAAMYERYDEFVPSVLSGIISVIKSSGGGGDGGSSKKDGAASSGSGKHKRICLRLLAEFVLLGIVHGGDAKPMVKAVSEASGAPPSSEVVAAVEDATGNDGSVDQEQLSAKLYPKYNVQDANMVVSFAKAASFEVAGFVPKSIQETIDLLEKEIAGNEEAEKNFQAKKEASAAAAAEAPAAAGGGEATNDKVEAAVPAPQSQKEVEPIDEDEYAVVSSSLITKAKEAVGSAKATCDTFLDVGTSAVAVPAHASMLLKNHLLATHYQLSTTLVTTHARLLKLEKRCEQDRLLQGQLSEIREKGLADAQKLVENLTKWVDGLAESLDLGVPTLTKEEEEDDPDAGTRGIELLGKDHEGEGGDLGPYDDAETKSFYTDVPDLLSTLPSTLLGLSEADVEKKKADNERKYGGGGGDVEEAADEAAPEVDESTADAFDEAEDEAGTEGENNGNTEEGEEDKDAPHYKLQVLLEQELPECHNRAQVDAIAEKFCSNHATSKTARKRLSRTLFLVPRVRLDLLPYYSRLACIMDRVFSDIAAPLVKELEAQFHGQTRWKKQQNLESRLKTARFLGELTKFQVAPPIVVMRSLRRCLDDFTGYNIDVACCLLESCGRYLYRTPHTRSRMSSLLETMMRIKKAKNLDERAISLITSAMYLINPPQTTARKEAKVLPPMEAYLKDLFMVRLSPDEKMVSLASKQVQRLPWSDPTQECGYLVVKYMLKACRKGRYKAISAVAAVASNLKRSKPEITARLADTVIEELQWALEHPNLRDQQRTIVYARVIGEMLQASLIPASLAFDELYKFINIGHDIPQALRDSSEKYVAEGHEDAAALSRSRTKFMAAGGDVSQAIAEDEEMEEDEDEETSPKEEDPPAEPEKPAIVAVSKHSVFDPRVPTPLDPPKSPFRISLVCTVLESGSSVLSNSTNKGKLEAFLAAFQRYLFTKDTLPTEVEFNLLDVFDLLDSRWKEKAGGRRKPKKEEIVGFCRYDTWLEAHNATVAVEEAQALSKERIEARLLAQAGVIAGDTSIAGSVDTEEFEDDMAIVSDDEDASMEDDDRSLNSAGDMSVDSQESDGSSSSDGNDSDEVESDTDGEDDVEDDELYDEEGEDELDEEAAQEAYMRQMEDDAFEREIRRLTMDALEKGKVTARGTGGKVSDNMPVASQLSIKKPLSASGPTAAAAPSTEVGTAPAPPPGSILGGHQGMSFQLLKKGHKGRAETKELLIPTDTNLARVANKQDDEAARERELLKDQVLRYAAESAEQEAAGGNVYMEQSKLQKNSNRKNPLTMEAIDGAFGSSNRRRQVHGHGASSAGGRGGGDPSRYRAPYSGRGRGLGGRGPPGRGGGGRLFNPGTYSRSTREEEDF